MHTYFRMRERACKSIFRAQKSVDSNIKFVEPCNKSAKIEQLLKKSNKNQGMS